MKIYHLLMIFLFISGCSSGLETTLPALTQQPTVSSATVTSTATQLAHGTLSPTLTPDPSHTISTPSQKSNSEITLELLRTNNGCDLPCWWGIIPNQTRWSDAEDFLTPFSEIYERQPPSEWFVYDVSSPISEEFSDVLAVRTVIAAQQGVVKEIETGYFDEKTYHLGEFLRRYGIPTSVFVSTYSSDSGLPPNQVSLSIDLYYPEKGINAIYGTYASVRGGQIEGCVEKSPHLFLWSPNEDVRTIDYILGWDKANTPYMRIEEATDLDIQDFYEKYVNPASSPCIQTPTNLWPSQ